MLQCILTGGKASSPAISEFLIVPASSSVFPLTHSVTRLELAIADPHPYVLNLASVITPSLFTLNASETRFEKVNVYEWLLNKAGPELAEQSWLPILFRFLAPQFCTICLSAASVASPLHLA